MKISDNINYDMLLQIIKSIPSCIFFKDVNLEYKFVTHVWEQLLTEDVIDKTDMQVRLDTDNAILATQCDLNIIKTKKGCSYVIESDVGTGVKYLELLKEPVIDVDGNVIGIVGLITDITEKTILQNKLNYLLTTDSLTGVLNRSAGTDAITISIQKSTLNKAFCLLDINKFKDINDTYGHRVGDTVLKSFGNALKCSIYTNDIVMRLGGDEFIILLTDVKSENEVEAFLSKLFENVSCIQTEELKHPLTISVGVQFVKPDSNFDSLYASADNSMYQAKKSGCNYIIHK